MQPAGRARYRHRCSTKAHTRNPLTHVLSCAHYAHAQVEKNTTLTITGYDKVKVGDFCAAVRLKRPPEPYKGKGIRYQGEVIKLKAGKAGGKKK